MIVQWAKDNPEWGEDSIRDRLANIGIVVSDRTVGNVLRRHGIPPAPERSKTNNWERFIEANWPHLVAIDFATFEVPDQFTNTVTRHHALYAIRLATREVRLLGVTDDAHGGWVANMARTLADPFDGFLKGMKYVIMDRDPLFTKEVKRCFRSIGCTPKVLPKESPKMNAYIERFIGTVRREIGKAIIPLSTEQLRYVLQEHIAYYNHEQNHQGLPGNTIPIPLHDNLSTSDGPIVRRSRLGKTLNYYYREAA